MTENDPQLPSPPREPTAAAKSAAWRDPRVRFWWILAGVLLVIALTFLVRQTLEWRSDAWLLHYGTAVEATISGAGGIGVSFETLPGRSPRPPLNMELSFEWQGQEHRVRRRVDPGDPLLDALPGRAVTTADTIWIHVHPDNPTIWTDLPSPPSLQQYLVAPMILLPGVLIVAAVGWLMRGRMLRVWRTGPEIEAIVADTRQSAIAPLSQQVRCTPAAGGDRRLISVFVPNRHGRLQKGDRIRLIVSPRNPNLAIPAGSYSGRVLNLKSEI